MVASVARKGDTPRFATSKPLIRPTQMLVPATAATIKATSSFEPEKPVAITAAVAIMEATDRSRPRTIMTKVWPIATMPSGAICNSRLETLPALRKLAETTPPIRMRAGNIRNMPNPESRARKRGEDSRLAAVSRCSVAALTPSSGDPYTPTPPE